MVTNPLASKFTVGVATAFLTPMILARVKEHLWCSGIFPPHAEVTVQEGASDAILINCSWPLHDNLEQPERRSTPVKIVIHGDLADHFLNADPEILNELNEALVAEVARRMKRYRAYLGLPYHRPPLPFEIRVGLGLMGGWGVGRS